jgi:hypothetical protein|nr:MAG TPA: hypothetical protein [Caudoviricetes sp.]
MKMLAKRIKFYKRKYRFIRFSSGEYLVGKLKRYKNRKKKQKLDIYIRYMEIKIIKFIEENKDDLFSN